MLFIKVEILILSSRIFFRAAGSCVKKKKIKMNYCFNIFLNLLPCLLTIRIRVRSYIISVNEKIFIRVCDISHYIPFTVLIKKRYQRRSPFLIAGN